MIRPAMGTPSSDNVDFRHFTLSKGDHLMKPFLSIESPLVGRNKSSSIQGSAREDHMGSLFTRRAVLAGGASALALASSSSAQAQAKTEAQIQQRVYGS